MNVKVLGINTSTIFGSVGLVDEDRVIGEYSLNIPVTHSERLMTSIDRLLTDTRVHLDEIEGYAVTRGPGSFTGLRIGIATVKGLAFATGRPVVAVSSLEALASNLCDSPNEICPVLDARKKEIYAARFRIASSGRLRRLTPDRVLSPGDLVREIHGPVTFLGDGLEVYGPFLRRRLGSRAFFVNPALGHIHGAVVARIGLGRLKRGETLDLVSLVPHYIRRSEAETKYEEKHQRNKRDREVTTNAGKGRRIGKATPSGK